MLITCPECGKEISDLSEKCVHCGYPIKQVGNNIININGKDYDFTNIISIIKNDELSAAACIGKISDMCLIFVSEARDIYIKIKNNEKLPEVMNCISKEINTLPKCPTCHSTNIRKISSVAKATNTAIWGVLGTKRYKNFHCNNCGYEW